MCYNTLGWKIKKKHMHNLCSEKNWWNKYSNGPKSWRLHGVKTMLTFHSNQKLLVSTNYIIPYILESNLHPFYSFRGLKIQMWIRIACELDLRSWAGFWKNDTAAVHAVRTIQYNNLLFYLLFIILYNIYNLLFIRLAVITHNWINLPCRQGAVEGKVRIRTAN